MSAYPTGTPINLVERFWVVDPLTGDATLANPTTVTFTIEVPDGTQLVFTNGDPNVSNPFVGVFVCLLDLPLNPGGYVWRAVGTGAVEAGSADHVFTIYDSALAPVGGDVGPGPCQPWISGEDVANCGAPIPGVGTDTFLLDDAAAQGSYLAYELSGRKYPGICTRTVRPCADNACAGMSLATGLYYWGWAVTAWYGGYYGYGWWSQEGVRACGCNPMSVVKLSGYPIREIVQVKIDGAVLPPLDSNNNPNYRLDHRRDLIRMADPGPPYQQRFWPSCQNLDLNDDQAGTFSVTYNWGAEPPPLGKNAAASLAREIFFACNPDQGKCQLPSKVTKVVRQGVTIDRITSIADLLKKGASGLPTLDSFIAASNPYYQRRKTAVFSPDLQQYARRVG